jgi:hypothetical protein
MDAPARSLAHLQLCAKGLRSAIDGEYARGIKMAKMAMENAVADLKSTIARVQEASKWKRGVADSWYAKGEEVCGDMVEEALKRAEAREEAEAKIRIMEDQCDELADLAEQAGKQVPAEAETEHLLTWRRRWSRGRILWRTWAGH